MQPGISLHKKKSGSKSVLTAAASRLLMSVGVCAAVGTSGALIQPAFAQTVQAQGVDTTSSRSFNIPAQPLTNALAQFGRQSGLQVVFPAQVSQGVRSNAVVGNFTPHQALARLLQGTGIDGQVTREGAQVGGQQTAGNSSEAPIAADGTTLLDTIVIAGRGDRNASSGSGYQGTPDWVYEAPEAVSVISREAIQNAPTRNARDLLDNVAGVYASRAEAQRPGISVNIRGLQDQDRIGMMIDGARQSFQRNGHGATQQTYVDTAFVRAIEVEKSGTSGVGSLGTLGGSVNFRTIVADDLIQPGRDWGVEVNGTTGTNAYNFDGSAAAAFRISDNLSILGGISHKNIGAYEVGKNGELTNGSTTTSGDTFLFSGQDVLSTILKAELDLTDDAKLTFGWVRNESDFSTGNYNNLILDGGLSESVQNVVNNTLTAALDWDPDSELIDLKARFYYNHTKNSEHNVWRDVPDSTGLPPFSRFPGSDYKMETFGGSLENTSHFDTQFGLVSLNYGGEAFHDDAKSKLGAFVDPNGSDDYSDDLSGSTPSGKRTVASGFANAKLEHDDWLMVQAGLRYDWFHTSGNTTYLGGRTRDIIEEIPGICRRWRSDGTCGAWRVRPQTIYSDYYYPRYQADIDRSEGAWLPSFTVAVKPYDWLQPFVKYSKSFRPPTVMETYLNGGHAGSVTGYWPNPNLEPERADTWEVGANIAADGIFTDDDSLRLKVVGFLREIENYIVTAQMSQMVDGRNEYYTSFTNILGKTRMKGVEIEANYDARRWYIGGAFTYNQADWPDMLTYNNNGETGYGDAGTSVIFVQPKVRVALDAGVRLFDEKLTVGARMTHVGATDPGLGTLQNNYKLPSYTTYDLYGSYAFNDSTKLRMAVTNLTDKAYVSALGADYYAMPGRTFTASLNFKF